MSVPQDVPTRVHARRRNGGHVSSKMRRQSKQLLRHQIRMSERERDRERETERQRERERKRKKETERKTETEMKRERESKQLSND
jgi:hypothetical protein